MEELRKEVLDKIDRLYNQYGVKKITIAQELGYKSTTALFKTVRTGKFRDKLLNISNMLDVITKKYSN